MIGRRLRPWQIFYVARKHLGPSAIAAIFGKSNVRAVYDWAQDPTVTVKRCKNPLEALHSMFQQLDTIGLGYVARAAVHYLETAIDPNDIPLEVTDIKPTITEEILADYSAVSHFQTIIESDRSQKLVEKAKQNAIDEIERTYARYLADKSNREI